MKKDYLLNLKSLAIGAAMVAGMGLMTGCGAHTASDEEKEISSSEETKDTNSKFTLHDHLIVNMGGTTYVIRECDDSIGDIRIGCNHGFLYYKVFDSDDNLLLECYNYDRPQYYNITSELQEEAVNEIEENAIEQGAILYRGLGK